MERIDRSSNNWCLFFYGVTANFDNNFMWKGKANISDEIINNINK